MMLKFWKEWRFSKRLFWRLNLLSMSRGATLNLIGSLDIGNEALRAMLRGLCFLS